MTTTQEPGEGITYLEVPIAIAGCIIYIFVAIAIHHYKETYHHMPWIHESSVACLIGVLMGGVILYTTNVTVVFDSNLFFYMILPPVIFSAGYSLKRKNFFKYMDLIAFFGIFGTILNFILIALGAYAYGRLFGNETWYRVTWNEALIFSAVLTGSDEVSARSIVRIKDFPRMGALIFGEGVVNDAMSIVLFKTFLPLYNSEHGSISVQQPLTYPSPSALTVIESIIVQLICSVLIGVTCGLLHALLMRRLPMIKHFPIYQTALVMLFGYMSYCAAEATGISGILTVFIAAVTLAHYSWYNLSSSAQIATRLSFAAISEIAEGFAFSYVGLSLWVYDDGGWNIGFGVYMLVVVIVARVVTILGLFKLCAYCFKSFRVPLSEQLGFTLGGVVRGCLCWAQILQVRHSPVLIKATLIIVMTTSLGCGVLLPMLLPLLTPVPINDSSNSNNNKKIESYIEQDSEPGSPVANIVPFPSSSTSASASASASGKTQVTVSNAVNALLRTPERDTSHRNSSGKNESKQGDIENGATTEPEREYHFEYEPFSADFPHTAHRENSGGSVPNSMRSSYSSSSLQHYHTAHTTPNTHYATHDNTHLTLPQPTHTPHTPYPTTLLSPDPLDDLRSNEELITLISRHSNSAVKQPSLTSMLFWQWVRFDETFMKPLFGGSDRRYRLLQERGRQLTETEVVQRGSSGGGGGGSTGGFVYSSNGFNSVYSMGSGDSNSDVSMVGIADTSNSNSNKHTAGSTKAGGTLRLPYMNRSYGSTTDREAPAAPLVHPGNTNTRTNTSTNTTTNTSTYTALANPNTTNTTNTIPSNFSSSSSSSTSTTHPTHTTGTQGTHNSGAFSTPITDSFWSPGGREYVLEEDREDELELEKLAEDICLLDRDNE